MAYVKLLGGLGNQLYQYSLGEYLKEKFQVPLRYQFYQAKNKNVTKWDLEITKILSNIKIDDSKSANQLMDNRYLLFIFKKINKLLAKYSFFIEDSFEDFNLFKSLDQLSEKSVIVGYWQTFYFADQIKSQLLDSINFDSQIKNIPAGYIKSLRDCNSVSIHIRRGDYKNLGIYPLLGADYYRNAIECIQDKLNEKVKFFIFSDDIEEAKKVLIFSDIDKFFVSQTNSCIEDFYLMSLCNHNIVANSTFSLWASYINQNPEKISIAPKSWFNNSTNNPAKEFSTLK